MALSQQAFCRLLQRSSPSAAGESSTAKVERVIHSRTTEIRFAQARDLGFSRVPCGRFCRASANRDFPLITDPGFYFIAVFAVLLLGLAKGGFSGVGQVATPLIALSVPPLQAAAIVLPILLVQDIITVWAYRRDWSAWNIKVMLPGAVVGIAIGWALAAHLNDNFIRLALGVVTFVFVVNYWTGLAAKITPKPSAKTGLIAGVLSGFTSMIAHAGAPPFQMHIFPQQLDRVMLAGTAGVYFAALNYIKVVPYFALGQFTTDNLATSAVLLPLAIATNFLGIWLVRRTPQELFYRIVYIVMFLISLELIRGGVMGILAEASS
jgi:uncharacterized membrane protein YfcA